jgi:hypothetical protein
MSITGLTLRATKGSALTHDEVDGNFIYLDSKPLISKLSDLTDTDISSVEAKEILTFDGIKWSSTLPVFKEINTGISRMDRNDDNYAPVGANAIDLSYSNTPNKTTLPNGTNIKNGAGAKGSFSEGSNTIAYGENSHSAGSKSISIGNNSSAFGSNEDAIHLSANKITSSVGGNIQQPSDDKVYGTIAYGVDIFAVSKNDYVTNTSSVSIFNKDASNEIVIPSPETGTNFGLSIAINSSLIFISSTKDIHVYNYDGSILNTIYFSGDEASFGSVLDATDEYLIIGTHPEDGLGNCYIYNILNGDKIKIDIPDIINKDANKKFHYPVDVTISGSDIVVSYNNYVTFQGYVSKYNLSGNETHTYQNDNIKANFGPFISSNSNYTFVAVPEFLDSSKGGYVYLLNPDFTLNRTYQPSNLDNNIYGGSIDANDNGVIVGSDYKAGEEFELTGMTFKYDALFENEEIVLDPVTSDYISGEIVAMGNVEFNYAILSGYDTTSVYYFYEGYDISITETTENGTMAIGNSSQAQGISSVSKGNSSIAKGNGAVASGDNSISLGESTLSKGVSSIAQGYKSVSLGDYSVADGNSVISIGNSSKASGKRTMNLVEIRTDIFNP